MCSIEMLRKTIGATGPSRRGGASSRSIRAQIHHAEEADPSHEVDYSSFGSGANARARFDFVALFTTAYDGLHVRDLGPVRAREPDQQASGSLPAASRAAARHSLSGYDLRADADCVLSDLQRYPLPATTDCKYKHLWRPRYSSSAAVGSVMDLEGAAGAREFRRQRCWQRRRHAEDARPADRSAARPAVDGVCDVPRCLGRHRCSDAADRRECPAWSSTVSAPIQTSRILL